MYKRLEVERGLYAPEAARHPMKISKRETVQDELECWRETRSYMCIGFVKGLKFMQQALGRRKH